MGTVLFCRQYFDLVVLVQERILGECRTHDQLGKLSTAFNITRLIGTLANFELWSKPRVTIQMNHFAWWNFCIVPLISRDFSKNMLKVKNDHRSKFSNISNWKEEA